jgi:diaminopimelate decarboxylase
MNISATASRAAAPVLALFPPGTTVADDGTLVVGGCRLDAIAEQVGTPAYVVDESGLRARAREFRDTLSAAWPRSRVAFASKAFPCVAAYRVMAEEGLAVDVAGGGEVMLALAAGVPPTDLVLHGNAKSEAELALALRSGVGTVVVDNADEVDTLERLLAARTGGRTEQAVLVRVVPGIEADTHAAVSTGHTGSKFGLSLPEARAMVERLRGSDHLRLDGVHVHVGSQILDTEPLARAVEVLAGLGEFDVYDLGGGLGARYTYAEDPPSVAAYIAALVDTARRCLPGQARLVIEPGRSMVARVGLTLYRVVSVKDSGDGPTFVAVDGGMGDNLEVSLYQQRFEATVADRLLDDPQHGRLVDLVGHHCESGDVLSSGVRLDDPRVGDLVAVPVTGAYCFTMANNYNGALRPPVVFVDGGAARTVVRRETYDDLLARHVG